MLVNGYSTKLFRRHSSPNGLRAIFNGSGARSCRCGVATARAFSKRTHAMGPLIDLIEKADWVFLNVLIKQVVRRHGFTC